MVVKATGYSSGFVVFIMFNTSNEIHSQKTCNQLPRPPHTSNLEECTNIHEYIAQEQLHLIKVQQNLINNNHSLSSLFQNYSRSPFPGVLLGQQFPFPFL